MRDVCVCDARARTRVVAGSTDTWRCVDDAERWTGGTRRCITRIPRPPGGIGTSDAGSLVESTHTFQGGGAIGTPFRGGKYIFFNFLYGVDIILIVKYYFMVFVKTVGAGKIYRRMFKRITLKTYRI